jgi:hypothetical protein
MDNWIYKYIGTGLLAILAYVIISNTLWLLFGSKLLQSLPGVNIKGVTGTLRIAIMLIMTILGFFYWIITYPLAVCRVINKRTLPDAISSNIQLASKIFKKI